MTTVYICKAHRSKEIRGFATFNAYAPEYWGLVREVPSEAIVCWDRPDPSEVDVTAVVDGEQIEFPMSSTQFSKLGLEY